MARSFPLALSLLALSLSLCPLSSAAGGGNRRVLAGAPPADGELEGFVHPGDAATLLKAAEAFQGFEQIGTWNTSNPCSTWKGVNCDFARNGRVINIRLGASIPMIGGSIPEVLSKLSFLKMLDLSYNALTGPIPWKLGYLKRLWFMDLSHNQLTGNIPRELAGSTSLNFLSLSDNSLSGNIPYQLGTLKRLERLDLSTNQLTGNVPTFFSGLPKLATAALDNNLLTGILPDIIVPNKSPRISLSNNFLYGMPSNTSDACTSMNVDVTNNCLLISDSLASQCDNGYLTPQRTPEECKQFCGLTYVTRQKKWRKPCQNNNPAVFCGLLGSGAVTSYKCRK